MAAPENTASVILATCHAQARDCLAAYKALPASKEKGTAELTAATIDALAIAVPYLALAVARSVGCEVPKPPTSGTKAK